MIDKLLGPLQHRVMKILWVKGPMSVHGVHDQLNEQRQYPELAYTTILTVCRNLTKNGAVKVTKGARCHVFEPTLTEQEYHLEASKLFVADVFGDNVHLALKVLKSLE